jgi:predicted TIM-barrel fold metal-dependent hydrolase
LILEANDAGELEDRFRARLDRTSLAAEGVVSLKSIIAYRTGLAIGPASAHDVRAAFERLKREATQRGQVRIAEKALLDHFLKLALEWCAAEHFPIQFHTGFGDPDVDLRLGNPLQLRAVFEEQRYRTVPLVLLHAGYPFVRELSHLAAVYPNVYLDLGLAIPLAATDYDGILRQALVFAPTSRVLWSSDGFTIPEHCWFAAVQGRRALGRVLGELIGLGALDREEAWEIAQQVLRLNALRLYGLEEPE